MWANTMSRNPLFDKLCRLVQSFRVAQNGNVAIIFGLSLLPVAGAAAAALDYSRANAAKAEIQSAIDATAMMLYQQAAATPNTDFTSLAQNYFNSLCCTMFASAKPMVTTSYTAQGGTQLTITATGDLPTVMLSILGNGSHGMPDFSKIAVGATSIIAWGNSRLRVALVLDNTGSLAQSNKMTALKSATKSLLTQLKNAAANNGDVYVSIIPFTKDVNVDPTNKGESWVNWDRFGSCSNSTYPDQTSCTATANGFCRNHSSYTTQATCQAASHTWQLNTWTALDHNTWNGCVTDRDQNYDQTNTAPTGSAATQFPAEQYPVCPVPLMGLTYDWTALNAKVDAMVPAGNTNQAIGLAWGWQSLTNPPLTVPAMDPNFKYQQVIILLTDGLNTQDRWYTDQASIDARQRTLCGNIRTASVTLYTVQVNTSGDPTSTLLQQCATTADKFFLLTSSTEIVSTFQQIGTQISQLRIAK